MVDECMLIPASPDGAMNKGVADVHSHVVHTIRNTKVFWDVNDRIPPEDWDKLIGSYAYFVEPGGIVRYQFEIDGFFEGHGNYEEILNDDILKDYFTTSRKYKGEQLEMVRRGEKCATLILLTNPVDVGHVDKSEFEDMDGIPVTGAVRRNGRRVKPLRK